MRPVAERNALIEQYLPLARRIAVAVHRRWCERADLDDVLQDAAVGLLRAVETYDPAKGGRSSFESYAYLKIRGEILDAQRRWRGRFRAGRAPRYVSLTDLENDEHSSLHEIPAHENTEREVCERETRAELEASLGRIDPTNAAVLRSIFFGDCKGRSLAARLGVQEPRVSQRKRAGLRDLRKLVAA